MIVLHVAREPYTGPWYFIKHLAAAQLRHGYTPVLGILAGPRWPYWQELSEINCRSLTATTPNCSGTVAHLYHRFGPNPVSKWVAALLEGDQTGGSKKLVCHFHNGWLAGSLLPPAGAVAGVREVVTFHGPPIAGSLERQPLRKAIHRGWARRLVRRGAVLISVDEATPAQVEQTLDVNRSLFHVIHNGIPIHETATVCAPPPPWVIGYAGALVESKGWHIAAGAAELLVRRGWPVRFLLAGLGPDRERAAAWCAERKDWAVFHGYVPDAGRDFIPKMHITCLPSVSEGMPLVVLEAMACGVVPVTTSVGGLRALSTGSGGVIAGRSIEEFASAIEALITNEREYAARSSLGRETVRRCFSIERTCAEYAAAYEAIIENATEAKSLHASTT